MGMSLVWKNTNLDLMMALQETLRIAQNNSSSENHACLQSITWLLRYFSLDHSGGLTDRRTEIDIPVYSKAYGNT